MIVGEIFIMEMSPPCRAVLLTAHALGIELNKIQVSIPKGENKTREFLMMNPAHSVPSYKDKDGTLLGDSHAIMIFLVEKYGTSDDTLYPKESRVRASVNQMLHFDSGNVFSLHVQIMYPMMNQHKVNGPTEQQLEAAESVYEILNRFLNGQNWTAKTDTYSIADFSLSTSILGLQIVAPINEEKYPNIVKWLERCDNISFYNEINGKGQNMYASYLHELMIGRKSSLSTYSSGLNNHY